MKTFGVWIGHIEAIPNPELNRLYADFQQINQDFRETWESRYSHNQNAGRSESKVTTPANKELPESFKQLAKKFLERKQELSAIVNRLLHVNIKNFQDETLQGFCAQIFHMLQFLDDTDITDTDREDKEKKLGEQLKAVIEGVSSKKKLFLMGMPKILEELPAWLAKKFDQKIANEIVQLEKDIFIVENKCAKFSFVLGADEPIDQVVLMVKYQQLLSALAILKSEQALVKRQSDWLQLQQIFQKYLDIKKSLKLKLGSYFSEALRVQRILDGHRQWSNILDKLDFGTDDPIKIVKLLGINKKSFYRDLFRQQHAKAVVEQLQEYISKKTDNIDGCSIHQALLVDKRRIAAKIRKQEIQLQKNNTLWQRCLLQIFSGLDSHISFRLVDRAIAHFDKVTAATNLPILRVRFDDKVFTMLKYSIGIMADVALVKSVGSPYQLICLLNNLFVTHIDILFKTGNLLDHPVQKHLVPLLSFLEQQSTGSIRDGFRHVKEFVRTDEIGTMEKEGIIQRLSSLCMHIGFIALTSGSAAVVPAAVIFSVANLCQAVFIKIMYNYYGNMADDETRKDIELFSQAVLYPALYTLGTYLWNTYFPRPLTSGMSDVEALKVFGFYDGCRETALKARYRELAKDNHPDKCGNICLIPMETVNAAYEVLKKKCQ